MMWDVDLCYRLLSSPLPPSLAPSCYIVGGGIAMLDADGFLQVLEEHDPVDSARRVLAFAKDMLSVAHTVMSPHNGEPVRVRVGM